MAEKNTNYTIAESVELPSKGLIYAQKVNPKIELRAMSARDEMKRLTPSATPLKTLADIIEGCMLEKPAVHVYDMAVGDYEYLLHKLRIISYGADYKVAVSCPHCGAEIETTAKLDELVIKDFDLKTFEDLCTFKLPNSGQEISIKYTTPRIMEAISAKAKELAKKAKDADIDFDLYAQLALLIDSVDEQKLNSLEMDCFIDTLTARDMNYILNKLAKASNYIGIDNELVVSCPKCNEESATFFRFGPEFFRPTDD